MKELEAYRRTVRALPAGVELAEAEAEKRDTLFAEVVNGRPAGRGASDKTALFVRAAGGGRTGMVYTQSLGAEPLSVLKEAMNSAACAPQSAPPLMNGPCAGETACREQKHSSFSALQQRAAELEALLRGISPSLSYVSVTVTETIRETGIVNSLGLDRTTSSCTVQAEVRLTAEGERRRDLSLETTASGAGELPDSYFSGRVLNWLSLPAQNVSLPCGRLPAVLDGQVLCNIFLTAWQMFSAENYLRRSTPCFGKLGQKIFADCISLSDLPAAPASGFVRRQDCEGTISRRVDAVRNGVFSGLMHNLSTAAAMRGESTGSAGRDFNLISDRTETTVIPSNFRLLPGAALQSDLLSALENGIYICESYDMFHSVNVASGDFSIPCRGVIYHGGKPVGMAQGITMSGNLSELFAGAEQTADDLTTVAMPMSGSLHVASPSLLVSNLNVAGG